MFMFFFSEGVTALVRGRVSSKIAGDGKKYLHVDDLVMDLKIKDVRLQVQKIFNNNRILSKYSEIHQNFLKYINLVP